MAKGYKGVIPKPSVVKNGEPIKKGLANKKAVRKKMKLKRDVKKVKDRSGATFRQRNFNGTMLGTIDRFKHQKGFEFVGELENFKSIMTAPPKNKTPQKSLGEKVRDKIKENDKLEEGFQKLADHYKNTPKGQLLKQSLAISGIAAGATILLDKKDDTLTSGAIKTGLMVGTDLLGDQLIKAGLGKMGYTVSDVSKSEVKEQGKVKLAEVDEKRWQKSMRGKLGVATAIGLTTFGVASILDGNSKLSDSRKNALNENQAERDLSEKMMKEKKKQAQMAYGYTDYGALVLEQFENRIGHYAMGNAKFY